MKQLSRKLAAFFLTLAILLSFATVAFAHDGLDKCEDAIVTDIEAEPLSETSEGVVSPQAVCSHNWLPQQTAYIYHGGSYISSTQCMARIKKYQVCSKCWTEKIVAYDNKKMNHESNIDSASCTGTVQTWHRSCRYCGGVKVVETHPCPGASHIGSKCLWLPV